LQARNDILLQLPHNCGRLDLQDKKMYSPIHSFIIFALALYYLFVWIDYIRLIELLKEKNEEIYKKLGGAGRLLFLNNTITPDGIKFLFNHQLDKQLEQEVLIKKNKLAKSYTIVFIGLLILLVVWIFKI
jgi:hypothetical protein